jgi:hypothetical protein
MPDAGLHAPVQYGRPDAYVLHKLQVIIETD